VCLALSSTAFGAATITISNGDPANVGFNDPTVVAPVGGNSGTTLGQQRLIAFQAAADKWGATLTSAVPITILATWEALTCTATGAVLGSAGATYVFSDSGATLPKANTQYPYALTNALAGADVLDPSPQPQIRARFNINLGATGCLTGTFWYLGLDAVHGSNIDLVTVLTHEFAHGLGFQTFTNASTGAQFGGLPSIWDWYLLDNTTNKLWKDMTNGERAASALNYGHLVWTGPNAVAAVPSVLGFGSPEVLVSAPATVAGTYIPGTASFGPALTSSGVTGEVMPVVDTTPANGNGCDPFNAVSAAAVNAKIALINRGVCGFTVKVKNAQIAGAIGVIIADNATGAPAAGLGGADATITIPAVRVTLADGNTLKGAFLTRSKLHSGMTAKIFADGAVRNGADPSNRPWMYAPNPFVSGSSVSHWDISAFPNQLMEPNINGDLTHEVKPPNDLTYPLLKDIGWQ
jgi:hypothetical protein